MVRIAEVVPTRCLFKGSGSSCTLGILPGIFLNGFFKNHRYPQLWASLVARTVKHLPAMRETGVRSLVQEDPLKKEMATHSSTLA